MHYKLLQGRYMKKILILLLGILLVGLFFFIQNNGSKTDNRQDATSNTPVPTEAQPVSKTSELQTKNETANKKPFKPDTNVTQAIQDQAFVESDRKALESKEQRELQKEVFADIHKRTMQAIEAMPACLESAETKDEALACEQELKKINKEFALLLGVTVDDAIDDSQTFVWNETVKENMIKGLDASIEPMQKMFSCLQSSESDKEQTKCLDLKIH